MDTQSAYGHDTDKERSLMLEKLIRVFHHKKSPSETPMGEKPTNAVDPPVYTDSLQPSEIKHVIEPENSFLNHSLPMTDEEIRQQLEEAYMQLVTIKMGGKQEVARAALENSIQNDTFDVSKLLALNGDIASATNYIELQRYLKEHPGQVTAEMEADLAQGVARDFQHLPKFHL